MKKSMLIISVLLSLMAHTVMATGLRFHGSIKNSIYSYESEEAHSQIYQYANLSLTSPDNRYALDGSMRVLSDARADLASNQKYRLYSLRLHLNQLIHKRLKLTIGRQFFHPGTVLGALDGLDGVLHFSQKVVFQFYAGTESPYLRRFETSSASERFVTGGTIGISKIHSSKIQLLYLRKADSDGPYWHLTGLNFDTDLLPKTHVRMQSHYDLENKRWHRVLLSARNTWSKKFLTFVEYKSQYPQVYANSYFIIFQPRAYQQARFGATLQLFSDYYIDGQYQYVDFKGDNATRFFLSLQNNNGSLGFVYEQGYAGDQTGLMFDYGIELLKHMIASVYVDYSKYRTEEIYEYDKQLANAARLSYRLNRHWSVVVEYQWLTNKFKEKDSRFLNHISCRW